MAKRIEEEHKTYLLKMKGEKLQRVTVPANWRVTFGPLSPGAKGGYGSAACLRFYETADKQRAIFTDVEWFRDESIKVLEKVTQTKKQTMRKDTPQGARDVVVEARVSEWRDPDKPEDADDIPAEFLKIGGPVETAEAF